MALKLLNKMQKLQRQAQALRQPYQQRPTISPDCGLLEFIPQITPQFQAPYHLEPVAKALESILERPRFLIISIPPQHGKTEILLHFIPWLLLRKSEARIAYASYAQRQAESKAALAQGYCLRAGLVPDERMASKLEWRLAGHRGGIYTTSVGGSLTGQSVDVAIVDDPVKDYEQATSAVYRGKGRNWYNSVLATRLNNLSSVILLMTRWHLHDLAGYVLEAYPEFEVIRIPAIADGLDAHGKGEARDPLGRAVGEPLWAEMHNLEKLEKLKRADPFIFRAMYQGLPQDRNDAMFSGAEYYRQLPTRGLRWAIGADLQYTAKEKGDKSAVVVMALDREGYCYVVAMRTWRGEIYDSVEHLKAMQQHYQQPIWLEANGPQKMAQQVLEREGLKIKGIKSITGDKSARAQALSAAWRQGKVLLPDVTVFPKAQKWLGEYLDCIQSFTGVNDAEDDVVDASVWAYKALVGKGNKKVWYSRQAR